MVVGCAALALLLLAYCTQGHQATKPPFLPGPTPTPAPGIRAARIKELGLPGNLALTGPFCGNPVTRRSTTAKELVASSRTVVLRGGTITPRYFAQHFRLVEASPDPIAGDVTWLFHVGGYQTRVIEEVDRLAHGNEKHEISSTLGCVHPIRHVLSPQRAASVMRGCIGPYRQRRVTYQTLDIKRQAVAQLTLSARSDWAADSGNTWLDAWVDLETGTCYWTVHYERFYGP